MEVQCPWRKKPFLKNPRTVEQRRYLLDAANEILSSSKLVMSNV